MMPRSNRPFCITSVKQHTLTIDEYGVPSTIVTDHETRAGLDKTATCIGERQNDSRGEGVAIEDEY